jgi:hypothetical protein
VQNVVEVQIAQVNEAGAESVAVQIAYAAGEEEEEEGGGRDTNALL